MLRVHRNSNKAFTVGLFRSDNPSSCGIVTLDTSSCVIDFEEKPTNPKSDLANAGIYIIDFELFNSIKFDTDKLLDIGFDLLPQLVGKMHGYQINDFVLDIGTHSNLALANDYIDKNPTIF